MTRYSNTMRDILSQIREGYSPKEIKMAIGIASDKRYKGGNMTGAVNAIEKIKKGLSDHPQVAAVLKRQNEDMDEPASPDESSMAVDQLKFMKYAAEQMMQHIQSGGEFPEWMQNKLSGTHEKFKTLYANIEHGEMKESIELEEAFVQVSSKHLLDLSMGYRTYLRALSNKNNAKIKYAKEKIRNAEAALGIRLPTFESVELDEARWEYKAGTYAVGGNLSYDDKLDYKLSKSDADLLTKFMKQAKDDKERSKVWQMFWKSKETGDKAKGPVDAIAYAKKAMKEEVELEEGKSSTGYELYHKDFSSAMAHAYDFAKKKFGIEVDPKEIDDKVASGPRKPSKGKTNSYRLMGKDGKKAIQVQVYGMDNGKYELNMYKESVDLEEGAFSELQITAKELAKYAMKSGGIDKSDFMKAAAMMKQGKVKELGKFTMDLDTEPRDKIIDMVKGAVGKSAAEKMFNVTIREEVELEEAMATWKVTVVKPVNKLKKGDSVSVKANNVPQALKKSAKAFGDSNLVAVPSTHFDVQKEEVELEEKLKVSDGLGAWVTDFQDSDAPQFAGKSKEERQKMAIAAFVAAGGKLEQKEEQEKAPENDGAKKVAQMRDDKKKTRIAQLQLQIAKAQETINKLNAQEKPSE